MLGKGGVKVLKTIFVPQKRAKYPSSPMMKYEELQNAVISEQALLLHSETLEVIARIYCFVNFSKKWQTKNRYYSTENVLPFYNLVVE